MTSKDRPDVVQGAEMLQQVFPMLATLAKSGTQRDRAGCYRSRHRFGCSLRLPGAQVEKRDLIILDEIDSTLTPESIQPKL